MWRNMVETAGGRPILGTPYVGLLAEQILAETATGPNGPGLMLNDGLVAGKRYRLVLQGAFGADGIVFENGSLSVTAPATGSYLLYEDNLLVSGTPTAITVGPGVGAALTAAVAGVAAIVGTGAISVSVITPAPEPSELVVEDGTAKPNADSYCSAAAADAHHGSRGMTTWLSLSATEKDQALRRATDYMLQVYGPLWAGVRLTEAQALDWPRDGAERPQTGGYWPSSAVPSVVVKACAELALRAAAGQLLGDQGPEVVEQTVGPITTKYRAGALQATRYSAVDAMLAGVLAAQHGSVMIRLVRG